MPPLFLKRYPVAHSADDRASALGIGVTENHPSTIDKSEVAQTCPDLGIRIRS